MSSQVKTILCIDGVTGSGKTTLINLLREKSPYKDFKLLGTGVLMRAFLCYCYKQGWVTGEDKNPDFDSAKISHAIENLSMEFSPKGWKVGGQLFPQAALDDPKISTNLGNLKKAVTTTTKFVDQKVKEILIHSPHSFIFDSRFALGHISQEIRDQAVVVPFFVYATAKERKRRRKGRDNPITRDLEDEQTLGKFFKSVGYNRDKDEEFFVINNTKNPPQEAVAKMIDTIRIQQQRWSSSRNKKAPKQGPLSFPQGLNTQGGGISARNALRSFRSRDGRA